MSGKKKGKTPPKKAAKSPSPAPESPEQDERAAARRVAHMRNKLTAAMQDPMTRDQIVQAIRAMMKSK